MKKNGLQNGGSFKIAVIGALLAISLFASYYFHFILKIDIIFTHFFYIPIILASLWWGRRGVAVAVFLALQLLVIHISSPIGEPVWVAVARAFMFVVIGVVVAILIEKKQILEDKLRAYSGTLERRVDERTSELKQSEEKRRAVLDGISDAVIVLDRDLNIIWANEVAVNQYGAISGRKCYEAYKWLKEPCSNCIARKTWEDGMIRSSEEEGILKDGSRITFVASCSPIRDMAGTVVSVVGVLHDITKRKLAEAELRDAHHKLQEAKAEVDRKVEERTAELEEAKEEAEHANQMKSIFLASMSHELRTPLNSIIGFTGIILQGLSGEINDEQKKQLNMVYASSKHLLALITDLLDISKIESGELAPDLEEFNLAIAGVEVRDSLLRMAEDKGLKLIWEMPDITVVSDKRRFKQIITNLASNAIKFTEKGWVEVSAIEKDKYIEVMVRDTGVGMKKEDIQKLFAPFIQLEYTISDEKGTGLGLYLARNLARLLGGEIRVESEYGKGSIFTFTLPINEEG